MNTKKRMLLLMMFMCTLSYAVTTPEKKENPDIPVLTQKQMLEDFEYLEKVVREVVPATAANKIFYGIDMY